MSKALSDNDVVKAFECCFLNKPCEECPLHDKKDEEGPCLDGDIYALPRRMVEIYNRQKTENIELKKKVVAKNIVIETQKAEIERLQTEIKLLTENGVTAKYPHCSFLDTGIFLSKDPNGYEKWNAYVRNQAYKEFAEETKKRASMISFGDPRKEGTWVKTTDIDNLLKEMVGE